MCNSFIGTNFCLKTLDIKTNQIVDIDIRQLQQFDSLMEAIKKERGASLLFRGNRTPQRQYGVSPASNIGELASYVFMVGDKAHSFWEALAGKPQSVNQKEYAEQLFDIIKDKICDMNVLNDSVRKHIHDFIVCNGSFKTYFIDAQKQHFISAFTHCKGGYINDYYCMILHTLGHSTFHNSEYLSTSLSFSQAQVFSGVKGIVTIAWVTRRSIMTFHNMNKFNEKIGKLGLPTYSTGMYPEQKEICLKYGLLPHFILGFIYQDTFIVNPTLFIDLNNHRDINQILHHGINIDQTNFLKILRQTNFKRGINLATGCYIY